MLIDHFMPFRFAQVIGTFFAGHLVFHLPTFVPPFPTFTV